MKETLSVLAIIYLFFFTTYLLFVGFRLAALKIESSDNFLGACLFALAAVLIVLDYTTGK